MNSSYSNYHRRSCHRHQSGGLFFIIPVIFILFFTHSWFYLWPFFIIFMIFAFSKKPRYNSTYDYQNSEPRFISSTNYQKSSYSSKPVTSNFCKNCGSHIESDSIFCSECGFKIY